MQKEHSLSGGFDALLRRTLFTNVVAGIEEGYDVIIFEDPINPLSLENIIFHLFPNWEKVCKP